MKDISIIEYNATLCCLRFSREINKYTKDGGQIEMNEHLLYLEREFSNKQLSAIEQIAGKKIEYVDRK